MTKSRKVEVALFVFTLLVLVAIWAANGYEHTWLYVSALVVAIPVGWYTFGSKDK